MDLTPDELAGIVDLFGVLTTEELDDAVGELAFKSGTTMRSETVESAVADAVDAYALVETTVDGESAVMAGPTAFPTLPEHAEDLPHIMDVPDRSVDRETVALAVRDRLLEEAVDPDPDRTAFLLEVCYDLESWTSIDADPVRDRLETG